MILPARNVRCRSASRASSNSSAAGSRVARPAVPAAAGPQIVGLSLVVRHHPADGLPLPVEFAPAAGIATAAPIPPAVGLGQTA